MTRQRSFKRLVRSRMEKTGESYTTARAVLLRAMTPAEDGGTAWFATSDDRIRERTGRGWEEWFDLLDEWGAHEMQHRDIARKVAAELGIDPLAWNAQAITKSYERTRQGQARRRAGRRVHRERVPHHGRACGSGVRGVHGRHGTVRVAPGCPASSTRTATAPKSAHFDWADDGSRVTPTSTRRTTGRRRSPFSTPGSRTRASLTPRSWPGASGWSRSRRTPRGGPMVQPHLLVPRQALLQRRFRRLLHLRVDGRPHHVGFVGELLASRQLLSPHGRAGRRCNSRCRAVAATAWRCSASAPSRP